MCDHCVPTNMASSWGGNTHPVFFNHNAICERFLTKFAKLTIDSPAAMAKLAIDRASIVFGKQNREIFIPNREIGRYSLFYQKSGDLLKNRETWKLWTLPLENITIFVLLVFTVKFIQIYREQ